MWVFFPLGFHQWHSCWPSSCATEFHLSRDLMIAGMSFQRCHANRWLHIKNKKTSLAVLSQRLRSENVLRSEQVRHRVHDSFTPNLWSKCIDLPSCRKKAVCQKARDGQRDCRTWKGELLLYAGQATTCRTLMNLVGTNWKGYLFSVFSQVSINFLLFCCSCFSPFFLLFFCFFSVFLLLFPSASLLFYRFFVFLLFLLFRFSASLLFRFFALPASQLFCFSAFVLSCSSFFSCVFFIFCFSCFSAFLLLRFFALPASLLFCFFAFLLFSCFILSCLYLKWSPRDETQQHPKDIPTNTLNETLNKAANIP